MTTRDPSRRNVAAGDIIIRQGEVGDRAYVLEDGRVEILVTNADGRVYSAGFRGPGHLLGEMALVDRGPRAATVRAIDDCMLTVVSEADLTRRLNDADPVLRLVMEVVLDRFRETLSQGAAAAALPSVTATPRDTRPDRQAEKPLGALERLRMAADLRDALDTGDLSLRYQPMVDIANGAIIGFEALLRWQHPRVGFISPDQFIPVAEETGMIVAVSAWVLDEACRALSRLDTAVATGGRPYMSVNFSSEDFVADRFAETVGETLAATGISAERLRLEITERVLMKEPDRAIETLRSCRDAGMSVAIDDFGTGFSSLSYLSAFPIDVLKIDRAFVDAMHASAKSLALVRSIIGIGKNLRMTVIAEGVETAAHATQLAALGCDQAQGYYYGKPLTEEEALARLRAAGPPSP